jgi:chemotaxis protein methyltransferase CheR
MSESAASVDRPALESLAALLLERAGLKITPDGYYGLRIALQARMPALGLDDAGDYVRRLRERAGEAELRALLPFVTVGKTEFFRDTRQFEAFEGLIFPAVLSAAAAEGRAAKLWSAGCATGEEPYSLAMVATERGATRERVDIWATDLNPVAAETAARGVYPARRLVGLSEERVHRFFKESNGSYEVVPSVRQLVRFEPHNLAAPIWPQVHVGSLDVIFCRNVIIYFDEPTIAGVMERFFEALRPGGWMFLGYSESLFKVSTRFEMVEIGGAFAYQRPLRRSGVSQAPAVVAAAPRAPAASPPASPALPGTRPSPAPRTSPRTVSLAAEPTWMDSGVFERQRTPAERLAGVVSAVEAGDFPKALRKVRRLTDDKPDDLAARLTLGNVQALMGSIDEAREAYQAVLAREPLCVEARLYLALTAMQARELDVAVFELKRALFLEPTLAVGHFLLGQVCERSSDLEGARRAYRNAVAQRRAPDHALIGHFPDLPRSNDAIAQAAQVRLLALTDG